VSVRQHAGVTDPVDPLDPAASVEPVTRILRDVIGMRDSAVSTIRLRHAAAALAAESGITLSALPARLGVDPVLRQSLIDRITVQESQFFRDASFFDALRTRILPQLAGPLTVWSAACAHGQEAWSVAMMLAEAGRRDWRIHATDVSSRALARARSARFAQRELRGLSAARRDRFMVADDAGYTVSPTLREYVTFAEHNLVRHDPPPQIAAARLVLLRNVLIYFEDAEIARLFHRLARILAPGAWVALGGSEILHPVAGFELIHIDGLYAYRATGDRATGDRITVTDVAHHRPAAHAATPPVRGTVAPAQTREQLLADAERHAGAGEHGLAVACFRRLVYLDPEDLGARLALALAFDAAGEREAARRGYRATVAALARRTPEQMPERLAGYGIDEVRGLLAERLDGEERAS
jgi:chemotaxis protein methyltransferase CheR